MLCKLAIKIAKLCCDRLFSAHSANFIILTFVVVSRNMFWWDCLRPLACCARGKCLSLPPEEAGVRTGCFSRGRCHGGQMSGHVFHTVIARHRHVYSTARPPDAVLIVFWSADPLWTVLCSASVSSAYHFRDILRLCQEWWSAGCLATRNYSGNFIFITNDRLQLCSMIPLQWQRSVTPSRC